MERTREEARWAGTTSQDGDNDGVQNAEAQINKSIGRNYRKRTNKNDKDQGTDSFNYMIKEFFSWFKWCSRRFSRKKLKTANWTCSTTVAVFFPSIIATLPSTTWMQLTEIPFFLQHEPNTCLLTIHCIFICQYKFIFFLIKDGRFNKLSYIPIYVGVVKTHA